MVKAGVESESKVSLQEEQQRAREQWEQDPCGAEYAREHPLGTREFFESVEQHRYTDYAPWMPGIDGFRSVCGKTSA